MSKVFLVYRLMVKWNDSRGFSLESGKFRRIIAELLISKVMDVSHRASQNYKIHVCSAAALPEHVP